MDVPCERRSRVEGEGWSIVIARLMLFMVPTVLIATLWWLFPPMKFSETMTTKPQTAVRENRKSMYSPYFPDMIPRYEVRRDVRTGQFVSRGDVYKKLNLTSGVLDFGEAHYQMKKRFSPEELIEINKNRVSFAEMQAAYQCAPNEPDFDTSSGTVSLLRMAPPTMKTGQHPYPSPYPCINLTPTLLISTLHFIHF